MNFGGGLYQNYIFLPNLGGEGNKFWLILGGSGTNFSLFWGGVEKNFGLLWGGSLKKNWVWGGCTSKLSKMGGVQQWSLENGGGTHLAAEGRRFGIPPPSGCF